VEIVVAHGYHPNVIEVTAGRPLRLVFRRDGDEPCTDRVVFSNPRMERRLARGGSTIVDIPPLEADTRFTCGMGRYHGRLRAVPGGRLRRRSAIGREVVGVALAGAVALVLVVVSLVAESQEAPAFAAFVLLADFAALGVTLAILLGTRRFAGAPNPKRSRGR
jgi:Cu+-exporting ATPase